MTDHLSRAHQLLASGQLDEARIYLEELLRQVDAENPDLLNNQGLLLRGPRPTRSGARAATPLPRARAPYRVALAFGYRPAGDLPQAKE